MKIKTVSSKYKIGNLFVIDIDKLPESKFYKKDRCYKVFYISINYDKFFKTGFIIYTLVDEFRNTRKVTEKFLDNFMVNKENA